MVAPPCFCGTNQITPRTEFSQQKKVCERRDARKDTLLPYFSCKTLFWMKPKPQWNMHKLNSYGSATVLALEEKTQRMSESYLARHRAPQAIAVESAFRRASVNLDDCNRLRTKKASNLRMSWSCQALLRLDAAFM